MIHAYRLVYPISEHAPPQVWEYEQPYIDNLLHNARTFDRFVTQWYFADWAALDRDCSRATGFIQLVHDEVRRGFVDGLRRGLHATYRAPDAHGSALASAPGRHSF